MAQDIQSNIIDVIDDSDVANHKTKQIKTVKQKVIKYDNDGNPTSSYLTNDIIVGANAYVYTNNGIALSSASSAEPSLFSVSIGDQTTATSNGGIAIGSHTTSNNTNSIAIGSYLQTNSSQQNQIVLGKFNEDDSNSVFTIGDGSDSGHTHNVFKVKQDGSVYLTAKDGSVNIWTNGSSDSDIVYISGNGVEIEGDSKGVKLTGDGRLSLQSTASYVDIVGKGYVSINSTGSASTDGSIRIGNINGNAIAIGNATSSLITIGSSQASTVNIGNTSTSTKGTVEIGNYTSSSVIRLGVNSTEQNITIGHNNRGNNYIFIGKPSTDGGTSTINIGLPIANSTSSVLSQIELNGRTHAEQLNVDSLITNNFTADTVKWGDGYYHLPSVRRDLDKNVISASFTVPYATQELIIALGDSLQELMPIPAVYDLTFTRNNNSVNISTISTLQSENASINNAARISIFSQVTSWFLLCKIRFATSLMANDTINVNLNSIATPSSSKFTYSYVDFGDSNEERYTMIDALKDISDRLLNLENNLNP